VRTRLPAWWLRVLGVLLVASLVAAILDGDRRSWIIVALLALTLAVELWARRRAPPE
jgi:hypothetical protein